MELLVCIKQVPDTSEIKLDPVTNNLIRTGLPSIVNPYDLYALEGALQLKDQYPNSSVTVITMGPPQAEQALRQCLALGADAAYLITDRVFGGADTLATSYTIASAIRRVEEERQQPFSLILCGKQAIDGDTAQVGPQIAEELGIPQVTYATHIECDGQAVVVMREHDLGYETVRVQLPCLITATQSAEEPRVPTLWQSIYAKRYKVKVLTTAEVKVDPERIGLTGSPTRVRKVYEPPRRERVTIWTGTVADMAAQAVKVCEDAKKGGVS